MPHVHRQVRLNPHDITFATLERLASDDIAGLLRNHSFSRGLICDGCGADERLGDRSLRFRARSGVYGYCACWRQFSITSGTAMHGTRLPLGHRVRFVDTPIRALVQRFE